MPINRLRRETVLYSNHKHNKGDKMSDYTYAICFEMDDGVQAFQLLAGISSDENAYEVFYETTKFGLMDGALNAGLFVWSVPFEQFVPKLASACIWEGSTNLAAVSASIWH